MALKTIEYTVTREGITRKTEQSGGTQSEHNVTEVVMTLGAGVPTGDDVRYRVQTIDGAGGFYSTEFLTPSDGKITFLLSRDITLAGGVAYLYLVATKVVYEGEKFVSESQEFLSKAMRLRFENAGVGSPSEEAYRRGITGALLSAQQSAEQAEDAKEGAEAAKSGAETAKSDAEIAREEASKSATDAQVQAGLAQAAANNINANISNLKLVGKRGNVSSAEVFNNYDANKAMSPYASASGDNTVAGTRCFSLKTYGTTTHVISNYVSYAKSFASNTQRLICVGDEYIILTAADGVCVQRGVVSKIKEDTITVTLSEYALPTSTATGYWFILLNKPFCGNTIYGSSARASGLHTMALANNARSAGYYTKALAMNATAEGSWTEAMGANSHSEGYNTKATGGMSHSEGYSTTASNSYAHAEGRSTTASGGASHSEGKGTKASGSQAHAEGSDTLASNFNTHAEGNNTQATKNEAHAEGRSTTASGGASHAEGAATTASGEGSHSEGINTQANGYSSHAEGGNTVAGGEYSHAGGLGTVADTQSQTAIGQYNKKNSDALFIVGNGSGSEDENRSNAFEVDKNGTAILPSLKDPNGNPDPTAIGTSEYSVATKGYVRQFVNMRLANPSSAITSLEEQIAILNRDLGLLSQRIARLEGGV